MTARGHGKESMKPLRGPGDYDGTWAWGVTLFLWRGNENEVSDWGVVATSFSAPPE